MNKVFLIGNLTRDPALTKTNSGTSVCNFAIAVNRAYTSGNGERETDFFNCTAWRGTAEHIATYCKKGSKVAVTGSIQFRDYEDEKGTRRTAVDIIVRECEFLTARSAAGDNPSAEPARAPQVQQLKVFDDDGNIPF